MSCCKRSKTKTISPPGPALLASAYWSSGGPFCLPLVQYDAIPCPTCDPAPLAGAGLDAEGMLAVNLRSGAYRLTLRAELRGMRSGARLVGLYRPDSTQDVEYLVRGFTLSELMFECGNPQIALGELLIQHPGGMAGIRVLGFQGVGAGLLGNCQSGASVNNLQVAFEPIDAILQVSSMVPAMPYSNPCPPCPTFPSLVGATVLDAGGGGQVNADGATNVDPNTDITIVLSGDPLSFCVGTVPFLGAASDQDPSGPCGAAGAQDFTTDTVSAAGGQTTLVMSPQTKPLASGTRYYVQVCMVDGCEQQVNVEFCFTTA